MNDRLNQFGRGRRWWSIAAGVVLAIGVLLWFVPYRSVERRACPISGSSLEITRWLGIPWRKTRTTTRLELWLRLHEPGFEPRFNFVGEFSEFADGGSDRSCGKAPIVFLLADRVDVIVDESDDAKIEGLVSLIRSGTREEQHQRISKLWEATAR